MLQITIPCTELWNESEQQFIEVKETTLTLEHSLVSVSKWESKWHKPFFSEKSNSVDEIIDYVRCMTITQNVNPLVYKCLSTKNIRDIYAYIDDPMTATFFSNGGKGRLNKEQVTSELIYYWMITLNIPPEYQKWHINRLITLIRICNIKNQPPKKMSKRDLMARNHSLNAARRAKLGTKG